MTLVNRSKVSTQLFATCRAYVACHVWSKVIRMTVLSFTCGQLCQKPVREREPVPVPVPTAEEDYHAATLRSEGVPCACAGAVSVCG